MVKRKEKYIPEKGDIVLVMLSSAEGHEQKGKRPALVVSSFLYNEKAGLALMCPITTKKKNYPFEVELKKGKTKGVILADQVRSVDYNERSVKFLEKTSQEAVSRAVQRLSLLLIQ